MRGRPTDFWGKSSTDRQDWHPLIDHCADVAACCEALLRRTLLRRRLATLGERDDLTEPDIQRLSALAAFHDVGKFNLGFQNKADPHRQPTAGHVQAILDLFGASASVSTSGFATARRSPTSRPGPKIPQGWSCWSPQSRIMAGLAKPAEIPGRMPNSGVETPRDATRSRVSPG